ncbi:MAG TPA: GEVED domain-containing protein [Verrucomicrobiales bacterium]|nr:GEVED domain-containing protein [Verrucomicrobiales bacterium]
MHFSRFLPVALLLFALTGQYLAAKDKSDYGDFSDFAAASSIVDKGKIRLGAKVDEDDDNDNGGLLGDLLEGVLGLIFTPNSTATADDATADEDEDSLTVPPQIAQGQPVTIPISVLNKTGNPVYLNAWVDFDNNGTLNDVIYTTAGGEKITNQIAVPDNGSMQVQNVTFTVPATASAGTGRGMRVRITDVSNPGPTGAAGKGEVEDYVVNISTTGFTYGIAEGSVYEINVKTGVGSQIFDMAFPGTGNAIAFIPSLGGDGVLVYGTGEVNDLRLAVWDRLTGKNNIAGNLTSFGMASNKVLRCASFYNGYLWTVVDGADDLWKITITGASGNYRIGTAVKVADIWSNGRGHIYGDFDVKPDGTALAIALNASNGSPEFFTFSLAAATPAATLRGTPPVSQNGVAFGLDGKLYGGLGLFGNNEAWYTLSQTNGTILTTTTGSTLENVADLTAPAPYSAPAGFPLNDYGDHNKFATAGSLRTNTLRLGGTLDGEPAPLSNSAGTADDTNGTDDEDGAIMPATMSRGEVVTIPITVYNHSGTSAYLNAWMDFDNNGTLNNTIYSTSGGERLMTQITVPTANDPVTHNVTFTVPLTASIGANRGLRVRLTSIGGQGPTGIAGNGEVEDYGVTIDNMRMTAILQVRPLTTATWSTTIAAEAGTTVEYRLTLSNAGNVTLRDPLVENLLPAVGDIGITTTGARSSAWPVLLTEAATVPSGVNVTYSLEQNPRRSEMIFPDPPGSVPPHWGVLPSNPTKVRAIKFDGTGLTLAAGASLTLTWRGAIPWDATPYTTAWNSVGATAVRDDLDTWITPLESNKPGVQALSPTGVAYGDTVWNDADSDGIQDATEPGVNDVLVELYRDNGDNVADPATDTFVANTYTATVSGKAGTYRFGKFAAGNYFAVVSPSDAWGFTTADQGSAAAQDSDVQTMVRNGRRIGVMPVTQIAANEIDLTWDAGLRDRATVPAVWAIAESNGGRKILGGRFTQSHGIARKNIVQVFADGNVDTTFNPGTGFDDSVRSIAIRSDGLILVGGNFTTYNGTVSPGIALLSGTGGLDPRPAKPNTTSINWVGANGTLMYLGGTFTKVGTVTCGNFARLKADGSVDTAFVNQGTGANGTIYSGAVQTDGSVILTGAFTSFHGTARKGVVKLKPDGKVDGGFNPGTGPNGEVYSVKLIDDGRMILTGNFASFNGFACNGAVRLTDKGAVDPTMNKSSLNVDTISTSN